MATYEIAHLQIFHDSQRKILNWLFPHFIAKLHFKKYSSKLCPQHMKEKNHYWCRVPFIGIISLSLWNRNGFKVRQNCFGGGRCILFFHTVINYLCSCIDCLGPFGVSHLPPSYSTSALYCEHFELLRCLGSFLMISHGIVLCAGSRPSAGKCPGKPGLHPAPCTEPGPGSSLPAGCIWGLLVWCHLYPLRQWFSNLFSLWPTIRIKVHITTQCTYNFNSTYVNM